MVFLMLTAAVKLDSLDVNLPSTESQAVADVDKQSITVNILKDEPYWLKIALHLFDRVLSIPHLNQMQGL